MEWSFFNTWDWNDHFSTLEIVDAYKISRCACSMRHENHRPEWRETFSSFPDTYTIYYGDRESTIWGARGPTHWHDLVVPYCLCKKHLKFLNSCCPNFLVRQSTRNHPLLPSLYCLHSFLNWTLLSEKYACKGPMTFLTWCALKVR